MHISVTGISHHTAPVSVRERFALRPEDLGPALGRLREFLGGVSILSTCNRTEVYAAGPTTAARDQVVAALAAARAVPALGGATFYHYSGPDAARHLFRVAAGVDSLVLGESEILGQVRRAFAAATAAASSNAVLARLFHAAIRAGRRARDETRIGDHGLSVSAAAVALSRSVLGDLRGKTVLVIGAGEAGRLAATAIVQAGAGRLLTTTRTAERAEEVARAIGGVAVPFSELMSAMREADIILSSTSAPGFVVSRNDVAAAMAARPDRRLVLVDIAVPRDIEPGAADVPGVSLYDMDAVQSVVEANLAARQGEVAAVEAIVEEELGRFQAWSRSLSVTPTIAAIQRQAEQARQAEIARTLGRLDHLQESDRRRIEAMSKALVKRILHGPVGQLRNGGQRHVGAARDLFGLADLDVAEPE